MSGSVTVQPRGAVLAYGATISGPIAATGPSGFEICGSKLTGPISVTGAAGLVVIGGATGSPCPGNTISGPISLTSNQDGVIFDNNADTASVTISRTTGSLPPPLVGPVQAVGDKGTGTITAT